MSSLRKANNNTETTYTEEQEACLNAVSQNFPPEDVETQCWEGSQISNSDPFNIDGKLDIVYPDITSFFKNVNLLSESITDCEVQSMKFEASSIFSCFDGDPDEKSKSLEVCFDTVEKIKDRRNEGCYEENNLCNSINNNLDDVYKTNNIEKKGENLNCDVIFSDCVENRDAEEIRDKSKCDALFGIGNGNSKGNPSPNNGNPSPIKNIDNRSTNIIDGMIGGGVVILALAAVGAAYLGRNKINQVL